MKTVVKVLVALAVLLAMFKVVAEATGKKVPRAPLSATEPSFEVDITRPFLARPFFGLLSGGPLHFDHASPGAQVLHVAPDRLELRADGWHLLIEIDGHGTVTSASRVTFPTDFEDRIVDMRCRPADRPAGWLRLAPRAGDERLLDGTFLVEFAECEDATAGKELDWPPAALTLKGAVSGLARSP
jgi:hypothetical protein